MKPSIVLSLLGIALTLSACAHPIAKPGQDPRTATPAPDVSKVCRAWKPILYDRLADTEDTIDQVQANNDARDALCGPPT